MAIANVASAQVLLGQTTPSPRFSDSIGALYAAPLNESGTAFAPDLAAQRNYGAAATMRTVQCRSIRPRPPS